MSAELDEQYKRLRRPLATAWRTKRSGISREMSLFMRVLSVAPREADAVGSLKVCRGGTAVGETREEGGKLYFILLLLGTLGFDSSRASFTKQGVGCNPTRNY